jgi:hypothetical protein
LAGTRRFHRGDFKRMALLLLASTTLATRAFGAYERSL